MAARGTGRSYVLMGVSSTGKSSVGAATARQLDAKFIDGDDLHPRANITKMADGQPLNDDDRAPWLVRINDVAFSLVQKNETGLIVCSALRKQYRDRIRQDNENLIFIHLQGSYELVKERMKARKGHFMPESLLKSQFETLEVPGEDEPDVVPVSIEGSIDEVVARCVAVINEHQ